MYINSVVAEPIHSILLITNPTTGHKPEPVLSISHSHNLFH